MLNLAKLIHVEACDVLFFTGIKCNNNEVREVFESSQMAFLDETTNRIHITRDLIKYCLEVTQKRHNHPVLNRSFGGGGTAAFWIEGDDWILPHNETHMAEIFRLAEEFNVPFMFKGCGLVQENDLEIMRKYYSGYIYSEVKNRKMIEDIKNDSNVCTAHSIITSPLKFNNNLDNFFNCLENNLPVYLTTMPISCFTGPSTIYSLVTLVWAEFLAGLCLSQLKNPGCMVVNGAFPTMGDPRNGYQPVLGSIAHNIANYTTMIISNFFSLPSIQSGGTTSNLIHNPYRDDLNICTTDYDTYNSYTFWNSIEEFHQVRHCFGFINNLTDFNINKMRRDCVTLQNVIDNDIKFAANIESKLEEEVFYDSETQEVIQQGSDNNFKDLNHTVKYIGILKDYFPKEF